ncbi:hypothetical protein B0J12DRAFT_291439 [Macrophomina phaseolina]|uniref:DUF7918 domain-containing protein n=1 Tax=Macrophomina phaseolina TaxID=35725 RepID=A0ABQ8GNP4_9PEZI|nr:hypothetical protein B0J12DRAFT_291439 [Macrophomina phaseolina]
MSLNGRAVSHQAALGGRAPSGGLLFWGTTYIDPRGKPFAESNFHYLSRAGLQALDLVLRPVPLEERPIKSHSGRDEGSAEATEGMGCRCLEDGCPGRTCPSELARKETKE